MRRCDVKLLDGRCMSCAYEVDDEGFILHSVHGAGGDLTSISEAEYDNIETQALAAEAERG